MVRRRRVVNAAGPANVHSRVVLDMSKVGE